MTQHLFNTSSTATAAQLDSNFSDLYPTVGDVNRASQAWSLFATPTIATDGSYSLLQLNGFGAFGVNGAGITLLTQNMGGTPSAPTRIGAAPSGYYQMLNGGHVWGNAPTGAAGSSITFTEVMRLTPAGQLGFGTTSPWASNNSRTSINYSGAATEFGLTLNTAASSGRAINFIQGGNASGGGSPTSVGSITITTTATAYNTSSDYRLKDNFSPIASSESAAFFDAINPGSFVWKCNGSPGRGFLAHELQAVSPSSVVGEKDAVVAVGNLTNTADNALIASNVPEPSPVPDGQSWSQTGTQPIMQAVEYGSAEVIAMMVAEIKFLRARLAAAGIA